MLRADVVICPHDPALQNGKVALNCVRMYFTANVLTDAVVHCLMAREHAANSRTAAVAHDVGRSVKLLIQDRRKVLNADGCNVMATDATAALNQREHRLFSHAADVLFVAFAGMLVRFLAAHVGLINFHGFAFSAHDGKMAVAHRFTQTMLHEPRGFVGNFQWAVKLMGADAFFAGRHQVGGLKPDVKLDVAALKNGADRDRKFTLAGAAAAHAHAGALHIGDAIEAAAARAVRTLRPYDCL